MRSLWCSGDAESGVGRCANVPAVVAQGCICCLTSIWHHHHLAPTGFPAHHDARARRPPRPSGTRPPPIHPSHTLYLAAAACSGQRPPSPTGHAAARRRHRRAPPFIAAAVFTAAIYAAAAGIAELARCRSICCQPHCKHLPPPPHYARRRRRRHCRHAALHNSPPPPAPVIAHLLHHPGLHIVIYRTLLSPHSNKHSSALHRRRNAPRRRHAIASSHQAHIVALAPRAQAHQTHCTPPHYNPPPPHAASAPNIAPGLARPASRPQAAS